LILIFPTASAALLALTLLAKAGFDPAEGDDPLFERSAHPIPLSLLAHVGISKDESREGEELLGEPSEASGVQRKGRGGFQVGIQSDSLDYVKHEKGNEGVTLEEGVDPNARVSVRFAMVSDVDVRKPATQSEWYARNGYKAGKERKRTGPYDRPDRTEVSGWGERNNAEYTGTGGEGRELSKRLGRGGGSKVRRGNRQTLDDLDQELEALRGNEPRRGTGGGRGERLKQPKKGKEDLDQGE
jgi:hypothetical protein